MSNDELMIAQNHNHVASVGFINCTVQRHPLSLEPRFEGEKTCHIEKTGEQNLEETSG